MQKRIIEICDKLAEQGIKPTLERVRNELGSGSFSTINPILKAWKESRENADTLPMSELPNEITAIGLKAAGMIWKAANEQCNETVKAIRHEAEQLTEQATIERDEALNEVKRLEAENERVTTKATEQANELNELRIKIRLAEAATEKAEEATKALRTELENAQKDRAKIEGMLTVYESIGKPAETTPTKTPPRKTKAIKQA